MYLGAMIFNCGYEDSHFTRLFKSTENSYDMLIDYSSYESIKIARDIIDELLLNEKSQPKESEIFQLGGLELESNHSDEFE